MLKKSIYSATVSILAILIWCLLLMSCKSYQAPAPGEPVDAMTRAVLDSRNAWHGGVIGGAVGTLVGATVADVSYRGSWEAAFGGGPVEYKTENGRLVYSAEPLGSTDRAGCRKVREKVWKDNVLVRDRVREICEGAGYEKKY